MVGGSKFKGVITPIPATANGMTEFGSPAVAGAAGSRQRGTESGSAGRHCDRLRDLTLSNRRFRTTCNWFLELNHQLICGTTFGWSIFWISGYQHGPFPHYSGNLMFCTMHIWIDFERRSLARTSARLQLSPEWHAPYSMFDHFCNF